MVFARSNADSTAIANAGSIGLHGAYGFRLVGTFHDVGYRHGGWRDTVLMQRRLGPGADAPNALSLP